MYIIIDCNNNFTGMRRNYDYFDKKYIFTFEELDKFKNTIINGNNFLTSSNYEFQLKNSPCIFYKGHNSYINKHILINLKFGNFQILDAINMINPSVLINLNKIRKKLKTEIRDFLINDICG